MSETKQPGGNIGPLADMIAADADVVHTAVLRFVNGAPDVNPMEAAGQVLQALCHEASLRAGWWKDARTGLDLIEVVRSPCGSVQQLLASLIVPAKLCLSHSEISEAMEGHRKGLKDDKLPHRSMLEVEIADAMIRLWDLSGALGLDVPGAIVEKVAYNAQRADHKPEARAAAGGKAY